MLPITNLGFGFFVVEFAFGKRTSLLFVALFPKGLAKRRGGLTRPNNHACVRRPRQFPRGFPRRPARSRFFATFQLQHNYDFACQIRPMPFFLSLFNYGVMADYKQKENLKQLRRVSNPGLWTYRWLRHAHILGRESNPESTDVRGQLILQITARPNFQR